MASIYKRPTSNVYQAQFYVTDPASEALRKVRKSTGQTNKKKAQAIADEMERNAQAVVQSGSERAQQAKAVLAEAVLEVERETFTALAARKYIAKLLQIATGEELVSYTIQTWADEWLRRKERDSSKATMARYRGHTKAFLGWRGDTRRNKPLESVTTIDARLWREPLQDEGRAGKTVLSYMKDASGMYRSAIREGLVQFNPFTSLEAIDTSDSLPRKPFTTDEFKAILAAAPSREWHGMILAAAFTGLRLGDCSKLSWDSIDLEKKTITLIPSKTKKKKREVRIPIHPDLLAYIEDLPIHSDKPDAPLFPSLSKLKVGDRAGLSKTFTKIMEVAGVDRGKSSRPVVDGKKTGKGNVIWEKSFHSFRHSFATWLRESGVSEEDRMALTGHTTREVHQGYSQASEAAAIKAIEKLPSIKPKP